MERWLDDWSIGGIVDWGWGFDGLALNSCRIGVERLELSWILFGV